MEVLKTGNYYFYNDVEVYQKVLSYELEIEHRFKGIVIFGSFREKGEEI